MGYFGQVYQVLVFYLTGPKSPFCNKAQNGSKYFSTMFKIF